MDTKKLSAIWRASLMSGILITTGVCAGCAQDNVELTLKRHSGVGLRSVAKGTTELRISKIDGSDIYDIEGLDRLPKLRKLHLQLLGRLDDISFLKQLPNLETLIIESCGAIPALPPFDWFPNLRHYVISNLIHLAENPSSYQLDLGKVPCLEYLQIAGCRLNALPTVKDPPVSLQYVSFIHNDIVSVKGKLATLQALRNVRYIFLDYNRIPESEIQGFPNVRLSGVFDLLPNELQYTY